MNKCMVIINPTSGKEKASEYGKILSHKISQLPAKISILHHHIEFFSK